MNNLQDKGWQITDTRAIFESKKKMNSIHYKIINHTCAQSFFLHYFEQFYNLNILLYCWLFFYLKANFWRLEVFLPIG